MITVRELIKLLKECDPKANVCLASDEERNHMRDFWELQYDDINIYFIPVNDDNENWDKMKRKIYRNLFEQAAKNPSALLEEARKYVPEA